MAMRDDARRLLDDLPEDDMPAVLRLLAAVKARRHHKRFSAAVDPETDEALTDLVRLSEESGQYQLDYSDYAAKFNQ